MNNDEDSDIIDGYSQSSYNINDSSSSNDTNNDEVMESVEEVSDSEKD